MATRRSLFVPEGLTPEQMMAVADGLAMEFRHHLVACGIDVATANRAIYGVVSIALDEAEAPKLRVVR